MAIHIWRILANILYLCQKIKQINTNGQIKNTNLQKRQRAK
jgi:hypothetical protein